MYIICPEVVEITFDDIMIQLSTPLGIIIPKRNRVQYT